MGTYKEMMTYRNLVAAACASYLGYTIAYGLIIAIFLISQRQTDGEN